MSVGVELLLISSNNECSLLKVEISSLRRVGSIVSGGRPRILKVGMTNRQETSFFYARLVLVVIILSLVGIGRIIY